MTCSSISTELLTTTVWFDIFTVRRLQCREDYFIYIQFCHYISIHYLPTTLYTVGTVPTTFHLMLLQMIGGMIPNAVRLFGSMDTRHNFSKTEVCS